MTPESVNSHIGRVPFFRFLAISVLTIDEMHAEAEMAFSPRVIGNPQKEYYHGGIIASFMEAMAAIVVKPEFDPLPAKPINLTVDYLRPAIKEPLKGRATVTRKGKRMASVWTVSWQESESQPVAEGLYHFLLV